jgi:hypothetical protein
MTCEKEILSCFYEVRIVSSLDILTITTVLPSGVVGSTIVSSASECSVSRMICRLVSEYLSFFLEIDILGIDDVLDSI